MILTTSSGLEHPTAVLGRLLRCWQELAIPPPASK
jgi:hypothetical protein